MESSDAKIKFLNRNATIYDSIIEHCSRLIFANVRVILITCNDTDINALNTIKSEFQLV